jgi:hypothetical protein
MATALAERYPSLHFIVQVGEHAAGGVKPRAPSSRVTIQKRSPGTAQPVTDGAVYILRLPPTALQWRAQIELELRAHLSVLRENASATLLLIAGLLPELGTAEPEAEAAARMRDLVLLQMANERATDMSDLVELVSGVRGGAGGLAVMKKLHIRNSATVALGIRYQADSGEQARMADAPGSSELAAA